MKNNFTIDRNYLFLALILILTWFSYLDLNLFSEDFLVLSFQKDVTFGNIFSVFFEKNIDGAYWRPITYLTYRIVELFSPDDIFLHRLSSFVIYSALSFALYRFLTNFKIGKEIAFLTTAFFATLYNHDLQIAWIPGRTDTLMTLFILLNAINIIKYYEFGKLKYLIFSFVFFILGILSKEHAIVAAIIPIIISIKEGNSISKRSIYIAISMSIIAILIMIYRIYVISGTPFSSENFSEINILSLLKNYFAYYFLSFFRPEELEQIYYFLFDNKFIAIIGVIIFAIIAVINRKKILSLRNDNEILFGFLWYSFMILPALPYLMRWYPFLPSIGLLIIISKLSERYSNEFVKVILMIVIFFNIMIANINFRTWQDASNRIENVSDISQIDKKYLSKLRIWALPDKYERVNMLKIAPDVYLAGIFGISKDSIDSPVRCEYYKNSQIKIEKDDLSVTIKLINGRLFPRGTKSTAILKTEHYQLENDDYSAEIQSGYSEAVYISTLTINYKKFQINDLYFNAVNLTDEKSIK